MKAFFTSLINRLARTESLAAVACFALAFVLVISGRTQLLTVAIGAVTAVLPAITLIYGRSNVKTAAAAAAQTSTYINQVQGDIPTAESVVTALRNVVATGVGTPSDPAKVA